ncbi:MAG: hypothetical protein Ct9H300mP22_1070 [Gammaproteobacteria bacterium]|nr:MAG: hypothetical protein Ct9H300mP22_1070 [Gammaproteobacteria bacterium]
MMFSMGFNMDVSAEFKNKTGKNVYQAAVYFAAFGLVDLFILGPPKQEKKTESEEK